VDSFDPTDLRFRVRSAFTGAELRRLLVGLGESEESLGALGTTELAHQVVRVGGKQLGPRELLLRLRAEKPLFEWPVLDDHDERWAGPMSLRMDPAAPSVAAPAPVALVEEASDTLVMEAPSAADDALLGGEAGAPPEVAGDSSHLPVEPSPSPGSSRFVTSEPAPPRSPRWLAFAAVAGLVVGLAGIAFGVGAWVGRAPEGTPGASVPTVKRAPRTNTPAGRASTLFEKALTAVGLVCDVNVDGILSVEILEMSLEACGRDEVDKLRRQRERDALEDRLDDARPRGPGPAPTSTPARPRGGAPADRTSAPGTPARPSCRQGCAASRSACQADCGKEPSDAARYAPYQTCISHCVADESRCRLGCR
jgi:hypothetical protein